jgi:hypothetical protein
MKNNIVQETSKSSFLLVLMDEKDYIQKLKEIIKSVENIHAKICYVCLSKPYNYIAEELRKENIDTNDFFFIDVLSSHYGHPKPATNCIFLKAPVDLDELNKTVTRAVNNQKCNVVLFDTISTLLIYHQPHSVIKFTHNMKVEEMKSDVKNFFIVLKGNEYLTDSDNFIKDLEMFTDKKIDV